MISYQSPGVYIEEITSGPQPITAAPTSVVAVAGATERGPLWEPTRITGWAEFQAVFGRPVSGGFTAQAMYGFFENGGPAAYVVRCDESVTTTWDVKSSDDTSRLFGITAASAGGWANGLVPSVVPDLRAGGGELYSSSVNLLVAGDTLAATAGDKALEVASVLGVAAGDQVLVMTYAGRRSATVASVDPERSQLTLTVTPGTALTLVPKATWVVAQAPETAQNLRLASGGAFQRGDTLAAVTPSKNHASLVVDMVTTTDNGLVLTLSKPLAEVLPAADFTVQTVRLSARLEESASPDKRLLQLTDLTWNDSPAPQADDLTDGHRAVAAGGLTGEWDKGAAGGKLKFPAAVPVGPVEVDVQVAARKFVEEGTLDRPTRAKLAERYSFVPDGAVVKLTDTAGTSMNLERQRNGDNGWLASADDPSTKVWEKVEIETSDATKGIVVRCVRQPVEGRDFIELDTGTIHPIRLVERPVGNVYVVFVKGTAPVAVGTRERYPLHGFQRTELAAQRFSLKVSENGTEVETYDQLAMHPDHPRFYLRDGIVNGVSPRITVGAPDAAAADPGAQPVFVRTVLAGSDRSATAAGLKRGFTELERVTEPAMVICPDVLAITEKPLQADVVGALTRHCEEFRRFAIIDAPPYKDKELADWRRTKVNSIQAGTYAPHVRMANLDPEAPERIVVVPPSGFVAGVFARTDRERGVHKAPANERVQGIVGLAQEYTQRRQDLLNPAGVNLIRSFPGRGTRVWGARTSTDDALWRYVNVRRLFNLIETSIERATNWVVFEPNTQDTWLRIRVSVENFLDQLFRAGALAGTSPEQAYRVRVGLGETMIETDVDQGLVITEVAVAPAKPAEFVVFRFSHKRLTE